MKLIFEDMNLKLLLKKLVMVFFGLMAFSCSDSDNGGVYEPQNYTVSGKVEKGPFVQRFNDHDAAG